MSREAMQMALHTLEGWANYGKWVWPESALEQAKRNTTESIAALRQALSGEAMKHIKTWSDRCEEHSDHQQGMVSKSMIQARMQEEIDELRQALVDGGNCYGDGTVYRGQRSKDSAVQTLWLRTRAKEEK